MNGQEKLAEDFQTMGKICNVVKDNNDFFGSYDAFEKLKALSIEKEVLDYWLKKEPTGKAMLGKYFYFSVDYVDGRIQCALWKNNDEYENDMYERSFGSNSGINEFTDAVILPFIASVADSSYSHAFGCVDVTASVRRIDGFSKRIKNSLIDDNEAQNMKNDIDTICSFCKQKIIAETADRIMDDYIDGMKKFYEGENL